MVTWARTAGWPLTLPLKACRVPFEAKAPWPGRETLEVTLPWPIRAPAQAALAPAAEIDSSLATGQVGRPLVWILPLELIARRIRSSFGGVDLSVVVTLPPSWT